MEKYIQGDVILVKLDSLPEGLVLETPEVQNNGIVLQHSEVTGHFHHFKSNAAVDIYRDPSFELTTEEIEQIGEIFQEKNRSIQAWGLFALAIEHKIRSKNI